MTTREGTHARLPFIAVCALTLACLGALACWPVRTVAAGAPPGVAADRPGDASRLIEVVHAGRVDAVRRLVGAGLAIDARSPGDGTALIVAARRGDLAMVDALLDLGANVDRSCPGDGDPLIAAAAGGHAEVIGRLLAAGAHVDAIVPGDETALIAAVRGDHLAAVQSLVTSGADVNLGAMADNGQWRTPLNQARSDAVAQFLRTRGATPGSARRR